MSLTYAEIIDNERYNSNRFLDIFSVRMAAIDYSAYSESQKQERFRNLAKQQDSKRIAAVVCTIFDKGLVQSLKELIQHEAGSFKAQSIDMELGLRLAVSLEYVYKTTTGFQLTASGVALVDEVKSIYKS